MSIQSIRHSICPPRRRDPQKFNARRSANSRRIVPSSRLWYSRGECSQVCMRGWLAPAIQPHCSHSWHRGWRTVLDPTLQSRRGLNCVGSRVFPLTPGPGETCIHRPGLRRHESPLYLRFRPGGQPGEVIASPKREYLILRREKHEN